MKNEEKYWVYVNHHYLTQYIIIVDIVKKIQKCTRNTMVPIYMVSFVFFKNIGQKKGSDKDGGRKIIWIYHQPHLLNSICNNGEYSKQIQKCTRNKMVPVSIVSLLFLKNSGQKTVGIRMEEKTLSGYHTPSLLNSICNNGVYRKVNQKHTRNKTVPFYIVGKVMNMLLHMHIFWFMKKIK